MIISIVDRFAVLVRRIGILTLLILYAGTTKSGVNSTPARVILPAIDDILRTAALDTRIPADAREAAFCSKGSISFGEKKITGV